MVFLLKRNIVFLNLSRYLLWDLKFFVGGYFIFFKRTGISFLFIEIIENIFFEYCICMFGIGFFIGICDIVYEF